MKEVAAENSKDGWKEGGVEVRFTTTPHPSLSSWPVAALKEEVINGTVSNIDVIIKDFINDNNYNLTIH